MPGAIFTYGKFNPVTPGHVSMFRKMVNLAGTSKKPYIIMSHTTGKHNRPLNVATKRKMIESIINNVNINESSASRTISKIMDELLDKHNGNVTMIVGANRGANSKNGKGFARLVQSKGIKLVSVPRNMNKGMSATKARMAMRNRSATPQSLKASGFVNSRVPNALVNNVIQKVRALPPPPERVAKKRPAASPNGPKSPASARKVVRVARSARGSR